MAAGSKGLARCALAPLVREVGDLYDPIAEDKGVTLRVEAANEATVHGDRDLLFEAVANLVDNAVKFTPAGRRVEITLLRQEGETVIRVKDTGPGIPESEREAVTKRFYRSDKSRHSRGTGSGLELGRCDREIAWLPLRDCGGRVARRKLPARKRINSGVRGKKMRINPVLHL